MKHILFFIGSFFIFGSSVEMVFAKEPSRVQFLTNDNKMLVGSFQKAQSGKPTVIMLHGLRSTKHEWKPLMEALVEKGWGVLAYDARGHGESSLSKDKNGGPDGFMKFGRPGPGSQWEKMIDDVGRAVRFVRKQDPDSVVFLAGASLGANVSLNYLALSRSVSGALLLSPGLDYIGIKTSYVVQKTRKPVLIVASQSDGYAYKSSLQLKKIRPSVDLWTDVKSGHGVQMFDENLISRILEWLQNKI